MFSNDFLLNGVGYRLGYKWKMVACKHFVSIYFCLGSCWAVLCTSEMVRCCVKMANSGLLRGKSWLNPL